MFKAWIWHVEVGQKSLDVGLEPVQLKLLFSGNFLRILQVNGDQVAGFRKRPVDSWAKKAKEQKRKTIALNRRGKSPESYRFQISPSIVSKDCLRNEKRP